MIPVKVIRYNVALEKHLTRAEKRVNDRQHAALDAQAAVWNELNDELRTLRGDARTPVLAVMDEVMGRIDAGIAERNRLFRASMERAGIWAPVRKAKPKARRQAKPKRQAKRASNVVKLRARSRQIARQLKAA